MRIGVLSILLSLSFLQPAIGQSGVKDSAIHFCFISVDYGYFIPGGDLADRFGNASVIGGNVLFKTKKNLSIGLSGGFIFGDEVNQPGLMDAISTDAGQVIGLDGLYAEVRVFERGYNLNVSVGKVISFNRPNPNSGLLLMGGPGFIQHKIRIETIGNTVPALQDDYLKGYDHLTNGFALHEFVGYVLFSNRQLINFYGGFEFIQGFTASRRDYNFDSPLEKEGNRIDLMYGVKVGWVLPLYKKKPAPYYLY